MQRIVLVPIVIGMILGCASKFSLESNSFINTTESYYSEWNSPIRDGGSGYSIYIFLDEKLKEPTKLFEIQGIYFKDTYVKLKHQNTSLYQGFIKNKISSRSLKMDGALKNSTINEIETIPFKLTDQEAVVVYKDKGSLKYTKINLLKKKVLEPPM